MYKIKQPRLHFRSNSRNNLYREYNYCLNYITKLKNVLYNINEEALYYLEKKEIAECIFEMGRTLERLILYFKKLVKSSYKNNRNFNKIVKNWRADNKNMIYELYYWVKDILFDLYRG